MPCNHPTLEMLEELEGQWHKPPSPSHDGTQQVWHPLPNGDYSYWAPLEDPWEMPEALRKTRNENEIVAPLTDECVDKLRDLWNGNPWKGQPSCGHTVQGTAHFHCYEISNHGQWDQWRANPASAGRNSWWCSDFRNAAQHYSFTSYPGGTFEQLAAALQSAMRRGEATLAAVVCLKILDWGGVRNGVMKSKKTIEWLDAALTAGTLIVDLEKAASLLCPRSSANLTASFGTAYPRLPMNSGSTKIFVAVAMDFSAGYGAPKLDVLIFDGRVSTGLGLIARELSCPNTVPDEFLFPYYDGDERRDSRCPTCAPFPRMSAKRDVARAEYARTASRCIQQVLGNHQPSADFVNAEKALFMIGYDVRSTCSGSHRVCRAGVGNAQPHPREQQPRAHAPSTVSGHTPARSSETLNRGTEFSYTGTPAHGTHLTFGTGQHADVNAAEYAALRAHFRGMRVVIGASRTDPPLGSLGAWLKASRPGHPAIASYVAPILIEAGWATKVDNRTIQFREPQTAIE